MQTSIISTECVDFNDNTFNIEVASKSNVNFVTKRFEPDFYHNKGELSFVVTLDDGMEFEIYIDFMIKDFASQPYNRLNIEITNVDLECFSQQLSSQEKDRYLKRFENEFTLSII